MVAVGRGFTVTVVCAVLLHPLALVPVRLLISEAEAPAEAAVKMNVNIVPILLEVFGSEPGPAATVSAVALTAGRVIAQVAGTSKI